MIKSRYSYFRDVPFIIVTMALIDWVIGMLGADIQLLDMLASLASGGVVVVTLVMVTAISQTVYNYRCDQRDWANDDIFHFTVMNCDFKRLQTTTGDLITPAVNEAIQGIVAGIEGITNGKK